MTGPIPGARSSRLQWRVRGVAQSGSASALGAEGRRFESYRPDHLNQGLTKGCHVQPLSLGARHGRAPAGASSATNGHEDPRRSAHGRQRLLLYVLDRYQAHRRPRRGPADGLHTFCRMTIRCRSKSTRLIPPHCLRPPQRSQHSPLSCGPPLGVDDLAALLCQYIDRQIVRAHAVGSFRLH